MVTQKELLERWSYNKDTGELIWVKVTPKQKYKIGKRVGCIRSTGHRHASFRNKTYLEHRLIWLMVTGSLPSGEVDHINGDPTDNRWCNLRLANDAQQRWNSGVAKNNTSGFTGVRWRKDRNKWFAQIMVGKKRKSLGHFESKHDAALAYDKAASTIRGEFHRRSPTLDQGVDAR